MSKINLDDWIIEHKGSIALKVGKDYPHDELIYVEREDGEDLEAGGEYYRRIYLNLGLKGYGWGHTDLPLIITRKSEIPVMEPVETEVGGLGLF